MSDSTSTVLGTLGFSEPMAARPKFHANNSSIDVLNVVPRSVPIEDVRHRATPASLDIEGFRLYPHKSAVEDFRDRSELERVHPEEIRRLLLAVSGADHVVVVGPGALRFGERSRPDNGRMVRRSAQYNVWRAITPPPQDVPLAVCDARSIAVEDFIPADAIFDHDGKVAFSFEALVIRHNSRQRWVFYSDMHADEALVFKTNDADRSCAHCVPPGAFDNPDCSAGVPPRASLEMRGIAYWFE